MPRCCPCRTRSAGTGAATPTGGTAPASTSGRAPTATTSSARCRRCSRRSSTTSSGERRRGAESRKLGLAWANADARPIFADEGVRCESPVGAGPARKWEARAGDRGGRPIGSLPIRDVCRKSRRALEARSRSTEELVLAKSRSTFGKRDREMAKAAKASAKRARREQRSSEPSDPTPVVDTDGSSADELVIQLRELHDAFEEKRMSFKDFDAARTDLVD